MEHSPDDAGVDLGALHDALKTSSAIHSDGLRREAIAKVTAGALLDIASSLRVLAYEAKLAMVGSGVFEDETDLADEGDGRAERELLLVGDLVRCLDEDGAVRVVTGVGITEGSPYADVALDGDPSNARRAWQGDLVRVPGVSVAVRAEDPEDPEVDDDDDDFTPAATALDALREAEKKPAKKKGKKS